MASLHKLLDESRWREVIEINGYAVLMGYLTMAIKGLGFLVLTWTTVVLLGGFVSMLHTKDFWCLTFITLVQTAGIARLLLACVLMLVQVVVLAAVLCPLAIIYVFGILMSGGISLWRLIEHDYGGNSNSDLDGEKSNLSPAMYSLYYIALLQGVLFCYRFSLGFMGKKFSKKVVGIKSHPWERKVIYKYMHEIRTGCEKDLSFSKGRNLITHAIDMISSNSPLDCISGVKMLYVAIKIGERELKFSERELKELDLVIPGRLGSRRYRRHKNSLIGQRMLMKHLVLSSTSSNQVLQKLLETLDSRGSHERKARKYAALIVGRLAFSINLEQFPRGIERISSLIGTFQEYSIAEPYQMDLLSNVDEHHWDLRAPCLPSPHGGDDSELWKAYKKLLLEGLVIIQRLATQKDNCRVISNTPDLISKIMAPITSDLLHHNTDHGAWSNIVEASMRVMMQLTTAPEETAAKICREISSCKQTVRSMERIIICHKCNEETQRSAILILTQLNMHTERGKSADFVLLEKESRENLIKMLVDILTHDNKSDCIRECAGGSLSVLCSHVDLSSIVVIPTSGDVVDSLIKVLVDDKNKICRQKAAEILEHLCTHYTKDDEYLGKLKKAMTSAIPQVLGEILRLGEETHNGKQDEQHQDGLGKQNIDIENQYEDIQGNDEDHKEEKAFQEVIQSAKSATLLSSLLTLCGTVYDMKLMSDLPPQLDASSFLTKLREMALKKGDQRTVENLSLFKAIAKLVISLIRHINNRSSMFVKQEDFESLIEALSSASKNMLDLDYSMIFRSTSSCSVTTSSKLDRCTFASLVKEAQELHARMPSTSASG